MKIEKIRCHPQTFGEVNKKYCDLKQSIKDKLEGHFDGEINLSIKLYLLRSRAEKSDLDNYLKAIIDAINEGHVINKESQIGSIFIKRIKVDSPEEEGVEIEITSV